MPRTRTSLERETSNWANRQFWYRTVERIAYVNILIGLRWAKKRWRLMIQVWRKKYLHRIFRISLMPAKASIVNEKKYWKMWTPVAMIKIPILVLIIFRITTGIFPSIPIPYQYDGLPMSVPAKILFDPFRSERYGRKAIFFWPCFFTLAGD